MSSLLQQAIGSAVRVLQEEESGTQQVGKTTDGLPLETTTVGVPEDYENISEQLRNLGLNEVIVVTETHEYLDTIDYVVVGLLMVAVLAVGLVASIHANEGFWLNKFLPAFCLPKVSTEEDEVKSDAITPAVESDLEGSDEDSLKAHPLDDNQEAKNFFLANKSMKFYFIGASLFASNIGSEHFVGQSGDGARRGLPVAMYEWYAAVLLIMLGWIFAPVYRRSGIYTTPEFLEKRFSPGSRHYLSFITCIMYVVAKLAASIYGGSIVLNVTLGWNLYLGAGVCVFLSAIYTIAGGLRAVMYTDLFQAFVFVIGGFVVMFTVLGYVGGYAGLRERLEAQDKANYFKLWRPADDVEFPWTGMMFGQPFTSIWYWCMDQDLVQRVLAAKNDAHSKAGCSVAAVLKCIPPFIMIIPGIVATTLFRFGYTNGAELPDGEKVDTLTDGTGWLSADKAYPMLLTRVMPAGLKGVMIASIMTAMMSSLDSVFNAGATIVSNDIYRVMKPNASPQELTNVGRVATVVFALLSFVWIPVIQNSLGLYRMVSEVQNYLGPPIGVIICVAVAWKRANGWGALCGLIVGGILGLSRMIVSVMINDPELNEQLGFLFTVPFLHYAIIIWGSTLVVCVFVSLLTAPKEESVDRYMVQWRDIFKPHEDSLHVPGWVNGFVNGAGALTLAVTFSLWIIFA